MGKININNATVNLVTPAYIYNGEEQIQSVEVILNNKTLIEGIDYHLLNNKAISPGNYILFIEGINNYKGYICIPWHIFTKKSTLELDYNELSFSNINITDSINLPTIENGQFYISNFNPLIVSTEISNGNLLITSLKKGDYKLTIICIENNSYEASVATITGISTSFTV